MYELILVLKQEKSSLPSIELQSKTNIRENVQNAQFTEACCNLILRLMCFTVSIKVL